MKDTKKGIAEQSEIGLLLEELVRRGARQVIQAALEVEVEELLADRVRKHRDAGWATGGGEKMGVFTDSCG